jgi:hypothetical protein
VKLTLAFLEIGILTVLRTGSMKLEYGVFGGGWRERGLVGGARGECRRLFV